MSVLGWTGLDAWIAIVPKCITERKRRGGCWYRLHVCLWFVRGMVELPVLQFIILLGVIVEY